MANDQIYNFITDYIDGIITREQFWVMSRFKYPTHQINFQDFNSSFYYDAPQNILNAYLYGIIE